MSDNPAYLIASWSCCFAKSLSLSWPCFSSFLTLSASSEQSMTSESLLIRPMIVLNSCLDFTIRSSKLKAAFTTGASSFEALWFSLLLVVCFSEIKCKIQARFMQYCESSSLFMENSISLAFKIFAFGCNKFYIPITCFRFLSCRFDQSRCLFGADSNSFWVDRYRILLVRLHTNRWRLVDQNKGFRVHGRRGRRVQVYNKFQKG